MKQNDFLTGLFGNSARAKFLRAVVFNPEEPFTAAQIGKRAGISERMLAREIAALERLGLIKKGRFAITLKKSGKTVRGKQKETTWLARVEEPHFAALASFIHAVSPPQSETVMHALKRGGKISTVILSGCFMGDVSRPTDVIVAGDALNERRIDDIMKELEPHFGRELRYASFSTPELRYRLTIQDKLLRDTLDYPHLVLMDRNRLFVEKRLS